MAIAALIVAVFDVVTIVVVQILTQRMLTDLRKQMR